MSAEALRQFWQEAWQLLSQAVSERDHPCRYLQLATSSEYGPEVRTLVLRAADPDAAELLFHTDARSAKAAQIAADPRVAVLGFDGRIGLQLRGTGVARLEAGSAAAAEAWQRLSPPSRRLYQVAALPQVPASDAVDDGYGHFCLLWLQLQTLDLLLLGSDGHRRARFSAAEHWHGHWLRP